MILQLIIKLSRIMRGVMFRTLFPGMIISLIIIAVDTNVCSSATITGLIPLETITGRVTSQNGYAWNYGYDIELKENSLQVYVAINLIQVNGVTKPELNRVKHSWKEGIERIWSEEFALVRPTGQRYPIVINVSFKGPRFHHEVIVRPGSGKSNELNWNIQDSQKLVAHEFGHMLGIFDEYKRGAVAAPVSATNAYSVMTNKSGYMITSAHHYEEFRSWFIEKTKLSDVSLQPI